MFSRFFFSLETVFSCGNRGEILPSVVPWCRSVSGTAEDEARPSVVMSELLSETSRLWEVTLIDSSSSPVGHPIGGFFANVTELFRTAVAETFSSASTKASAWFPSM